MIGKTISHYRIIEELGRGGMGVVYKAEDTTLKRLVALKFLPAELTRDAEAKNRFVHEAQASAALNHANIVTVHEINEHEGQTFIVMEYMEGRTLKDMISVGARRAVPLPITDAITIASQITRGLAKAHEKGIVHRDLKPANIFVTSDQVVKILDFGIAKLAHGQTKLTKTGTTMGTAAYMSPEQAMGKEVDRRADIWSLGVVLYEMLAGKLPFQGEYEQALIYSILNEEPEPLSKARPDASSGLEQIVGQALAKEPAERYQSMEELLEDLEAVAEGLKPIRARRKLFKGKILGIRKIYLYAGLAVIAVLFGLNVGGVRDLFLRKSQESIIRSIAVLPLENLSGDPEQEYIAEGMHDALITDLAQLGGLQRVIGRSSVMRFKGTNTPLRQIAQELKVAALITGAVLRSGDRVRVTAQLINPATEAQLWAHSYERDMRDVLSLQDEIVAAITQEIKLQLTPQDKARLTKARPVKPETYEAYQKGMFFLNKRTPEGFAKGLAMLQQAIDKDPTDPLPYAGLALGIAIIAHGSGSITPVVDFPRARAAALKALELDESSPQAHVALAAVKLYFDYDWPGAEREFRRALELNPNLADAHLHYSAYQLLFGRDEAGLAEAKRAVELDPLSPLDRSWLGWVYWGTGQPDKAVEEERQTLEIDPNFPDALYVLGSVYADKGMFEQAITVHKKLATVNPDWRFGLAETYVKAKREGDALKILADLERENYPKHSMYIAWVQITLGNKEETFRALEAAYKFRHIFLPFALSPTAPWGSDPRAQELRRRLNFPVTAKK